MIDADLTLEFDGRTSRPEVSEASISFSNMSFTHDKFPYRVDRGKGSLELKNDLLTLDVTAFSGSQPVRMKAKVNRPLHGPTGWFKATGDDIQIDKDIIKALPEKPQEVAQKLDPHGTINFKYHCLRDVADQPMHHYLRLNPNGCSICYSNFPYRFNNIRGLLEMRDHFWTFRNLTGMNESAKITGKGNLTPSLQGNKFTLNLAANDVPLDQELHNALRQTFIKPGTISDRKASSTLPPRSVPVGTETTQPWRERVAERRNDFDRTGTFPLPHG